MPQYTTFELLSFKGIAICVIDTEYFAEAAQSQRRELPLTFDVQFALSEAFALYWIFRQGKAEKMHSANASQWSFLDSAVRVV